MTVVSDDAEALVAWLAPDTPIMRVALPDGRRLRDVPMHERHSYPRSTQPDSWRGAGTLKIAPTAVAWSVWLIWRDDSAPPQWYFNLEDVHVRDAEGIVTRDHELDVVVRCDGTSELKDDDELDAAVEAGRFTAAEAAQYRRDARTAIDAICAWPSLLRGWESWRPDSAWPLPALPSYLAMTDTAVIQPGR